MAGFLIQKRIATMVRFASNSKQKIIETIVGFLRKKGIPIMVRCLSNSSKKIIETTVRFPI